MTFLLTLTVFVVIVVAMSVGVIFGRPPITGSCGGLGAVGIDQECVICGGNPQRCEAVSDARAVETFDPQAPDR
jgi:hypothetical protein